MPNALSSALRPSAASTPSPRPISEATSPVSAASPSTEPNTWRRLAPTTRSSASSRVRCPTVIENVLKIVNAPTNNAISAKISSAVEMNDERVVDRARKLAGDRLAADDLHARREEPGDRALRA